MTPTKEWLKLWMENREQLSCQQDLSEYFEQEEVVGCPVRTVRVGLCPLPSGSLVAFDPCAAADCPPQPYLVTAPVGNYPLELCIAFPQGESPVCAAARLRFNYEQPVHFEQALTGLRLCQQKCVGLPVRPGHPAKATGLSGWAGVCPFSAKSAGAAVFADGAAAESSGQLGRLDVAGKSMSSACFYHRLGCG